MAASLEEKFTAELPAVCNRAQESTGVRDVRFLREIEQRGGVQALAGRLRRGQVSPWFDALAEAGRAGESPEALAVQSRFGSLFTDAEVNVCFDALCGAGWYTT